MGVNAWQSHSDVHNVIIYNIVTIEVQMQMIMSSMRPGSSLALQDDVRRECESMWEWE